MLTSTRSLGDGLGVMISSTLHCVSLGGSRCLTRPIKTAISLSGNIVPLCEDPNSRKSVTDISSLIFWGVYLVFVGGGPAFQKSLHSRQQFFFRRSAPPETTCNAKKKSKQNVTVLKRIFFGLNDPSVAQSAEPVRIFKTLVCRRFPLSLNKLEFPHFEQKIKLDPGCLVFCFKTVGGASFGKFFPTIFNS